jgi:thymidylate synthase (FAD)
VTGQQVDVAGRAVAPIPAAALGVWLIAWTHADIEAMRQATGGRWSTDADGGQAVAEFAGRACYQSWTKPNPATATNEGYLAHIVEIGHLSVLEHGTASFYFDDVSRSFTHELVRHRHLSYSQLSQRYVDESHAPMVEPAVIGDDPELHELFLNATEHAKQHYQLLVARLEEKLADTDAPDAPTQLRKRARQAARSVLPNATQTRIVVTGNYRAWRHFIDMRATEHADVEIRQLAVAVLSELRNVAPNVFADYQLRLLDDGTWAAESKYAEVT